MNISLENKPIPTPGVDLHKGRCDNTSNVIDKHINNSNYIS